MAGTGAVGGTGAVDGLLKSQTQPLKVLLPHVHSRCSKRGGARFGDRSSTKSRFPAAARASGGVSGSGGVGVRGRFAGEERGILEE